MYQHGHGTCSAWAEPWTRMAQNCWRRDSNTDDQADLSDTQNSDPAGTATANDPSRVNARTCGNALSESLSPSASSQLCKLPAEQAPSLRSSSCTSPSSSPDTVSSDTADADPLEEMLVQQHLQRTQAQTTLASTASEEAKLSFEKIKWRSVGQEGRRPSFLATATAKGVDADQDATAVQRL